METPIRILYVDDNRHDCELVRHELEKESCGFQLTEAAALEPSQARLAQGDYDLVLGDLNALGGLQAIDAVRAENPDLPIVIVTSTALEEIAVRALARGATDYVIKNTKHIQHLPHAIRAALERARLEKARKRAQEQIQASLERIRALHEIDEAIASTLDLETVLQLVLQKVELFCPFAAASGIRLIAKGTKKFTPLASRNIPLKEWEAQLSQGRGILTGELIEKKAPLVIPNMRSDRRTHLNGFARKHGLVSYLGAPLIVKGEMIGSLVIYTNEERPFSDEELELVMTLASQAAIAIQNAQLYRAAQEREAQLQTAHSHLAALHAVTVTASRSLDLEQVLQQTIEEITKIFHFDATGVYLYDRTMTKLDLKSFFEKAEAKFVEILSFARGEGHVGRVAETGEPLIYEDTRTDPRYLATSKSRHVSRMGFSFLASFPIKGRHKNLGALICIGERPRRLERAETQLLISMTDQIAITVENAGLYQELQERVEELQLKTGELERANKIKTEFLSLMSHELRTPLSVVTGYVGLIRERILGEINPQQEEALTKVILRTEEQLVMINNILFATVTEAERLKAGKDTVNIGQLFGELKGTYEIPRSKNLVVEWDYSADIPVVIADKEKVKHILQNLITNALKFTDKGKVKVSARMLGIGDQGLGIGSRGSAADSNSQSPIPNSRFVEFKVSDTGIGIPQEHLPFIFNKFHQVDSSETRLHDGVGMGLYIVKQFAKLLGGTVAVESAPGRGSTFTVRVPVEVHRPLAASQDAKRNRELPEARARISR